MDKVKLKVRHVFSTSIKTVEINEVMVARASEKYIDPFLEDMKKVFDTIGVEYEIETDEELGYYMEDMRWC